MKSEKPALRDQPALRRLLGPLSLRATLLWTFALVIALSLRPAVILEEAEEESARALDRVIRVDMSVSDIALRSVATFLDARRHEKDFLLQYGELGVREARARYATQAQVSIAELREQMAQLRELAGAPGTRAQTEQVERAAAQYLESFLRAVDLHEVLAAPSGGLWSKLGATLDALEPAARGRSDLRLAAYLDLYRATVRLLDDPDPASYALALNELAAFERAAPPGPALTAPVDAFRDTTTQIMEARTSIAEHRAAYLDAARQIEPLLNTLHLTRMKAVEDAFAELRRKDKEREMSAIASGAAALLAAVMLAIVIAVRIGRGVDALVACTRSITEGNLDTPAPAVKGRELGQLAAALDVMTGRLRESRDLLTARNAELAAANEVLQGEIAERKRTEQALHDVNRDLRDLSESNRIAAAVIRSAGEGVMVIDAGLRIESVNPAFEKITGYAAGEALGHKPRILFSGRHEDAFFDEMHHLLDAQGAWQGEIWNRRRGGELYPQHTSLSVLRDAGGSVTHYAAVFRDRTVEYQAEAKLRELASLDGLTGIANRRTFDETLAREWSRALRDGRPLSLMMADIDYFKRYNDHNGHPAGDECLRRVARSIADCVNRAGDLAARYGGEEFAVILPNTDAAAAGGLAEKVCAQVTALALPHGDSAVAAFVTVSVGVATLVPAATARAASLVSAADRALYRAKQAGRNRVVSATEAEPADARAHA